VFLQIEIGNLRLLSVIPFLAEEQSKEYKGHLIENSGEGGAKKMSCSNKGLSLPLST
jgi:hypothetical protein